MGYIDVKYTVWERNYFNEDDTDLDKLKLFLAVKNFIPNEVDIQESELLYDTLDDITVEESNYSPIEIVIDEEIVYVNNEEDAKKLINTEYSKFQEDFNGEESSDELYNKFIKLKVEK